MIVVKRCGSEYKMEGFNSKQGMLTPLNPGVIIIENYKDQNITDMKVRGVQNYINL